MTKRIIVVGDVILDRYFHCTCDRINTEGPGVVMRVDHVEDRLGGAAAVAWLCAGMGAAVELHGVAGQDECGTRLWTLLADAGIDSRVQYVTSRRTTVKMRTIANGVLRHDRIDVETVARHTTHEDVEWDMRHAGCVLVADYAKGYCTQRRLQRVTAGATSAGVPLIVDPGRGVDWSSYCGATAIKANSAEFSAFVESEAFVRMSHGTLIIETRGAHGLAIYTAGADAFVLPATPAVQRDVTGAGDTVLATIGVGLMTGLSLVDCCRHAVVAAARQVESIGVVQVPFPILDEVATCRG